MSGIKGKIVVITGASSGIGGATALMLAEPGRTNLSKRTEVGPKIDRSSLLTAAGQEAVGDFDSSALSVPVH